jgi:hypothetical protein
LGLDGEKVFSPDMIRRGHSEMREFDPALAPPQKRQNITVGEFLAQVKAKADHDPKTLEDYAKALRKKLR